VLDFAGAVMEPLLLQVMWSLVLRKAGENWDDIACNWIVILACIFFAPLATSLPKQIDGAALLFVSVLFVRNITDIEWDDIAESAPAILAMIAMPLTYSISNGIALAFVSYALIKLFTGKFSTTSPAIFIIAILSVISFAVA